MSSLKRRFLVGLMIASAILPLVVLYRVLEQVVDGRRRQELAVVTASLRADLERALDVSEALLRRVAEVSQGRCTPDAVHEMQVIAYGHPQIREVGLIRDGRLECTSWGPVPEPTRLGPDALYTKEGRPYLYAVTGTALKLGGGAVIANWPAPGGAIVDVLLETDVLLLRPHSLSMPLERVVLAHADGRVLASVSAGGTAFAPERRLAEEARTAGPGRLLHRERLERHDLELLAIGDPTALPNELRQVFLPLAPIALIPSALVIWAIGRRYARRMSPLGQLEQALDREQFGIVYQPVIELGTGRCVGAEALMTWRHPDQGAISPAVFIPLAEESGLIVPMTEWLLRRLLRELGPLLRAHRHLHVAINLSRSHFEDEQFVRASRAAVASAGVEPRQILYEVTERSLVLDGHLPTARLIRELREQGSAVAIDDFGTGYSSLGYLRTFTLDYLKVDKIFVEAIGTEAVTAPLVDSIIDLARRLGLGMIAEGIETEAQARYLVQRGVEYGQGWYYSRPLVAHELDEFVRRGGAAPDAPTLSPWSRAGDRHAPAR